MPFFDLSTRTARSSLKPRRKAYWHRIVPNHHVGLFVSKTNGASWVSRIRTEKGGYHERTLGRATLLGTNNKLGGYFGFKTALKKAMKYRDERYKSGVAISPFSLSYNGEMTICPIGDVITVGHALKHFIEWRRLSASPTTFTSNLSQINCHLVPRVSMIPLADFNGEHFYKLCKDVLETAPNYGSRQAVARRSISTISREQLRKRKKTLNTLISILRTAFTLAYDRNELEGDRPIRCLRMLPNDDKPNQAYLTRPQCKKLLNASKPNLRNLIAAGLYTGCRVSELTEMRVCDVVYQGFGVYVTKSKSRRPRFVFLPSEGMAFFLKHCEGKEPQSLIFPHLDGASWGRRYVAQFKTVVKKTDLPSDVSFHTLRHSYASQLVEDGTPLSIVARQLGHSSTMSVDKVYGYLSPAWSEHTIEKHFARLQDDLHVPASVLESLQKLRNDPTGLARKGDDRRTDRPPSKADTMIEASYDTSWPVRNNSLFQGRLLKEISPFRNEPE